MDGQYEECSIYGDLVTAQHNEQQAHYMVDLAIQVLNALIMVSDPPTALTEFIRNLESWVFADIYVPQEFSKEYGLLKEGKSNK